MKRLGNEQKNVKVWTLALVSYTICTMEVCLKWHQENILGNNTYMFGYIAKSYRTLGSCTLKQYKQPSNEGIKEKYTTNYNRRIN